MKKEQWQLPKDVFISSEDTIYVRQVGLGGNEFFRLRYNFLTNIPLI